MSRSNRWRQTGRGDHDDEARRAAARAAHEHDVAEQARVEALVRSMVRLTDGTRRDDGRLETYADALVNRAAPSGPDVVLDLLETQLRSLLDRATRGGWPTGDLEQLIERSVGRAHLPTLDAVRHRRPLRDLASALGLAGLLLRTPVLDARAIVGDRATAASPSTEHPKLAQVRALLAKAESTDYPEEAELLSAKAQELVARHALDGLLAGGDPTSASGSQPQVRRLWLDAPYVDAKAGLVAQVAEANRCRAASAGRLGFCVVVGDARDLDAVELLVTSLLVQAGAAMHRHAISDAGRRRSFRRAFLFSYAVRVGERLREATAAAYRSTGGDALPQVLAAVEERVAQAFDEALPDTVTTAGPSLSNGEGWVAGRAAADLARLEGHQHLEQP